MDTTVAVLKMTETGSGSFGVNVLKICGQMGRKMNRGREKCIDRQ